MNFTPALDKFKYRNNISVSLAGGLPGNETSKMILRQIVSALCQSVQELNLSISIVNQKVIYHNACRAEDRDGILFYALINSADICSRQLFQKPLDKKIADKKPTDLVKKRMSVNPHELQMMITVLKKPEEIYDTSKKYGIEALHKEVMNYIKTEQKFIELIDALFTIEGFDFCKKLFKESDYPQSNLIDFVYNLKNGCIYKISPRTPSPHEFSRQIVCFDNDSISAHEYTLCYDIETGTTRRPCFSHSFIHSSFSLFSELTGKIPVINKKEVEQKYHMRVFEKHSDLYGKFIKQGLNDLFIQHQPSQQFTIFNHPKVINDFYLQDEIKNATLELLNQLPGLTFIGKKRSHPAHTVDAIINCNDPSQARAIQAQLEKHGLKSTVIKFNGQNNPIVCVQAINVECYARSLRHTMS